MMLHITPQVKKKKKMNAHSILNLNYHNVDFHIFWIVLRNGLPVYMKQMTSTDGRL